MRTLIYMCQTLRMTSFTSQSLIGHRGSSSYDSGSSAESLTDILTSLSLPAYSDLTLVDTLT